MQPLQHELRDVIARRVQAAGPREILAIASTLCAEDHSAIAERVVVLPSERFQVSDGMVTDQSTGLTWSQENVPGGQMKWKAAQEACSKLTLGGFSDWRLPTIREFLTIVDYERSDPAIDTDAFKCDSGWYWSSTPLKSSPSVCAWVVSFDGGASDWDYQVVAFRVRAVRSSQSFDLWHVR